MSGVLELYLHIPFCVRKCNYCDFLSAPYGEERRAEYMQALARELKERACECRDYEVSSVFIGGGTPSILHSGQITELMEAVCTNYRLSRDAEITMEVNPQTVWEAGRSKFAEYRKAGINRVSLGLQSVNDNELKLLGRIHTYRDFADTYRAAVKAGFENINVDLMSGIPGQTLSSYEKTLKTVIALEPAPTHISAYSLIVEEGTPFFEKQAKGELKVPDEDTDRAMYELTGRVLSEAGYERYEISNYARYGYVCRHNIGYWRRAEYLGFGIGAASLFQNKRFQNSESFSDYLADPCGARKVSEVLSKEDCMEEFMFLGLRMMSGVSYAEFERVFGKRMGEVYGAVIEKNKKDGLLYEYEHKAGEIYLALTKRGIDISNYVFAQFLF